jgi:hypothetical protein
MVLSVPRPKKAPAESYGEKKKNHSFMLTPTASEGVEELADACRLTRSELIERVIRELKTGKYNQILDAIKATEES